MVEDLFNSKIIQVLTKTLDTASLRQQVIANNVANLNTPGFKKSNVSFETSLREALETGNHLKMLTTDPRHLSAEATLKEIKPEVIANPAPSQRPDGNNVDIVEEIINLTMNNFNYQASAQLLSGKLAGLRYVVNDGRR